LGEFIKIAYDVPMSYFQLILINLLKTGPNWTGQQVESGTGQFIGWFDPSCTAA